MSLAWRPQPLMRVAEAFDHPDWLFELKHDGFRAMAHLSGGECQLVSRTGHLFRQWPELGRALAGALGRRRVVLDGEVVCLRPDGNSDFRALLFRRQQPYFYAFDVLADGGADLRPLPLLERKRRLRDLIPPGVDRLRFVEHLEGRGRDLFEAVRRADAEGIVAKWNAGAYHSDGLTTSWLKVKNRDYTQVIGRHELFASRERGRGGRRRPTTYTWDRAAPRELGSAIRSTSAGPFSPGA